MTRSPLRIVAVRGDLIESAHGVSAAVTDASGRLLMAAGDPDLTTWWRSAAKPFQALPLVQDGAARRFGLTSEELALACASHSSEPRHREVAAAMLAKGGLAESDLSCGVHTPMSPDLARAVARGEASMSPIWSNCSGKHAGMLLLARHHGWPLQGYQRAGHPVQNRILQEVSRWTGLPAQAIHQSEDGCTAVCFGLPLRAMAASYARLASTEDAGARAIVGAMTEHPFLVAGTGRLCTDLMQAWPGRVIAKVGAEGVYSAALLEEGLGIALKVEDGEGRAASIALLEVLGQALERLAPHAAASFPVRALAAHGRQEIRNTRGVVTGWLGAEGRLRGLARAGANSVSIPAPTAPIVDAPAGAGGSAGGDAEGDGGAPAVGSAGRPGLRALDRPTEALVAFAAAVAVGEDTLVDARIRDCLSAAVPADWMDEALLQSLLIVGWPRALNAARAWRRLSGSPATLVEDGTDYSQAPMWRLRGEAVCSVVYGGSYERLRDNIRALHPDIEAWMVTEGYGRTIGRPGLDLARRELCIVAQAAVQGADRQLHSHLVGALHAGASADAVAGALQVVGPMLGEHQAERAAALWKRIGP